MKSYCCVTKYCPVPARCQWGHVSILAWDMERSYCFPNNLTGAEGMTMNVT